VNPNENLLRILDTWQIFDTRRPYTGLQQCYFRGIHTTYSDANFVVMLCFRIVYAVLAGIYGIYHLLFSLADDVPLLTFLLMLFII